MKKNPNSKISINLLVNSVILSVASVGFGSTLHDVIIKGNDVWSIVYNIMFLIILTLILVIWK